ncbi:2-oxoglutarate dehydrogenase complex dihydrolipoyllysine-residue succinyltransferase [Bacillus sonorensis]|uniref:Dihydrolipoyllysine-residue succinyltransferase component of 2-oxoglutarate dehydrogenase complex n=2 Tax=Bacillus sonorensis TaxID=119858 RepID=M5PFG9_9BACI|nr:MULTISPECIES: 2-oxoglutarate dehydrogenase complex dihydrolipoyllysine-residue succinyltransferase [Bacillus]TWK82403.1 Dihydrolipoyllysine-residue succinyltransferase component of 2-oxoglutarate dehydrogenase complex [Bacillus paralicheniformis]ASB88855.1 Dihydrolipoyllysine-residue succinyltransferase [Bacillus sonorensis]EME76335.1 dihydrolipoamide succinyltransferase [Bacillus sonorensis L12]MBG9915352.1 dihydrolipoamide succinyltransferase [Bacillus sonorensis]MCF7618209.1 2-oxoglutara
MAEIKVPELAESISEGTIAQWLKQPGDYVEQGEFLLELETDKVNVELTAEQSGVLQEVLKDSGDTVQVGEVIGTISEGEGKGGGDSAPQADAEKSAEAPEVKPAAPEVKADTPDRASGREENGKTRPVASPAARKLAREKGIDLSEIPTGDPLGRVRKQDVESYQKNEQPPKAPAAPKPQGKAANSEDSAKPVERQRMSRRRQTIAKRLVEVQHTAAMLTTFNEVDMTAVMDLRKRRKDQFLEQHDVKLGFMSFFTKAVVAALKKYPLLNAEIQGDELVIKKFYDIGIAVAAAEGLVVPVVRDADRKTFADIEKDIGELAKKARNNKLSLSELQGGSFTITNGGTFGSLLSTPILNSPQVGILGMHKIQLRPVAIDEERFENRPMMYIALSYDHRIVDGKEAVGFLVTVKNLLEDPEQLLLEG